MSSSLGIPKRVGSISHRLLQSGYDKWSILCLPRKQNLLVRGVLPEFIHKSLIALEAETPSRFWSGRNYVVVILRLSHYSLIFNHIKLLCSAVKSETTIELLVCRKEIQVERDNIANNRFKSLELKWPHAVRHSNSYKIFMRVHAKRLDINQCGIMCNDNEALKLIQLQYYIIIIDQTINLIDWSVIII